MAVGVASDVTHVSETPLAEFREFPSDHSASSPSPKMPFNSNMAKFQAGLDWRAQMDGLNDDDDNVDAEATLRALLQGKGADTSDLTTLDTSLVDSTPQIKKSMDTRRVIADSDEEEAAPTAPNPNLLGDIQAFVASAGSSSGSSESRQVKKPRLQQLLQERRAKALAHLPESRTKDEIIARGGDSDSSSDHEEDHVKQEKQKKRRSKKDPSDKPAKKKKGLSKSEKLEMDRTAQEIRRNQYVALEPVAIKTFDVQTFLTNLGEKRATQSSTSKPRASITQLPASSARVPSQSSPPVSSTPLEQHATAEVDDQEDSQDISFLETQSQSESYLQVNQSSRLKPDDTDPIESTSPFDPLARRLRPDNAKDDDDILPSPEEAARIAMEESRVASLKALKAKAQIYEDRARSKSKAASESDSDSDLDIVMPGAPDPRSSLINFKPTHSRAPSKPTETQFNRAGKTWGPTASGRSASVALPPRTSAKPKIAFRAPLPINHNSLNSSLQEKARQQSLAAVGKKRQSYLNNGGKERNQQVPEEQAQQGASALKEAVAQFGEAATKDEDEDEADSDFNPDEGDVEFALSGDEKGSGSEVEMDQDDEAGSEDEVADQLVDDQAEDDSKEEEDSPASPDNQTSNSSASAVSPQTPRDGLKKDSSISDISPTQLVSPKGPIQQACPPIGFAFNDPFGDDIGFSQMPEDDAAVLGATQMFNAATQKGFLHEYKNLHEFELSQTQREQLEDGAEANPWLNQAEIGGRVQLRAPQYVNEDGMFTQTRPIYEEDTQSQENFGKRLMVQDQTSAPSVLSPIAQDSDEEDDAPIKPTKQAQRIPDSPGASAEQSAQTQTQLQPVSQPASPAPAESQEVESDASDEEEEAPQPEKNAFQVLLDSRLADQVDDAPQKKKFDRNNFIQDQADESDEDEGFRNLFGGPSKRDEDEEDEDEDGVVENLVDDANIEATLKAAQDKAAAELAQKHELEADQKLQKRVEKDARGAWRTKRRQNDVLSDTDYSDDEFGTSKNRKVKAKKRKIQGKDEMDALSANPETQAFVQAYNETHTLDHKETEIEFLVAEDVPESDEEAEQAERVQRRLTSNNLRFELEEHRRNKAKVAAFEQTVFAESSSPSRSFTVKDRTVVQHVRKVEYTTTDFTDIDKEYIVHQHEESQHLRLVREQEAKTGFKKDDFAPKTGQGASITNMTRKPSMPLTKNKENRQTSAPTSKKHKDPLIKRQNSLLGKSRRAVFK